MGVDPKPEFATNRGDERVADAINAHLAHLRTTYKKPVSMAIATAYFNVAGYLLLADELEHLAAVRLLLGAEPDPAPHLRRLGAEPHEPARLAGARLRRALEDHERDLAAERDLLGFTLDADAGARRLVDWLRSGRVEVRRLTDRFLHGKAFVVTDDDEGVIAGSSNLTQGGLATNVELNLGHYQPSVVSRVRSWFDELWEVAEPFDLAALYEARYEPHEPQLVYLRMLWERYGAELSEEARQRTGGHIHLTSFQEDGLWRARRILDARGGVLIADEVGLGKTFLAGKLIEEAAIARRQRVLVVAPATLRDGMWRKFCSDFNLPVEIRSYDELSGDQRLNPHAAGYVLSQDPDDYALVVVDEAHYLRNPSTQRSEAVRRLLTGRYPKELVLLTATPVNNSLWDLYYLLTLFVRNDAAFSDVGVGSLRQHFADAMALDPQELSPEHLFDVLDAVAVRRTRSFVKRFYPADTVRVGGSVVPLTFPTPRVIRVDYDFSAVLPGFFDRLAAALDVDDSVPTATAPDPGVLTLARYVPSRYRVGGRAIAREAQLAGLLRSALLKRFESSPYAFARTCRTMAESHDAFLRLLGKGKVAMGEALAEWASTDTDDPDELDRYMRSYVESLEDAADYDVETLRAHVAHDRDLLLSFACEAEGVSRDADPSLAALVEELATIAEEAEREGIGPDDVRDKRKVLVFSYFTDTVDWITEHLEDVVARDPRLAAYRGRIASLTGTDGDKADVLFGFAPRTTDAPSPDDRYDIVVSTDVLAEGVNLQQARHIINYDLPWNPMRLVQRHGRIDRIGSPHREVFIRCFFPDDRLDDLLGLEERLQRKISQAAAAVGVGEVLPGSTRSEVVFAETREEIERLRAGDAGLFELGGTRKGVLSGEEYRQELRRALEDPDLAGRIRALPWGAGSGMAVSGAHGTPLSYVFCIRVADHPTPLFRLVTIGEDGTPNPDPVTDALSSLDRARPPAGWGTPRVLPDEVHGLAYDAWAVALNSVVVEWNEMTDPAKLAPAVPRAMREAADLVRGAATGLTVEERDAIVDSLEAPYGERIVKIFRQIVTDTSSSEEERAAQVVEAARSLGLQPPPAPEPLPPITEADVHLVCWLAVVPETAAP